MQAGQSIVIQMKQELQAMKSALEKEKKMTLEAMSELKEANIGLELKEKVISTIKGQVETLGAELEQVQTGMMKKEKLLNEKLSKAKAKLIAEQKERKNLEGRLKDSQQALQQRQEDILAL